MYFYRITDPEFPMTSQSSFLTYFSPTKGLSVQPRGFSSKPQLSGMFGFMSTFAFLFNGGHRHLCGPAAGSEPLVEVINLCNGPIRLQCKGVNYSQVCGVTCATPTGLDCCLCVQIGRATWSARSAKSTSDVY